MGRDHDPVRGQWYENLEEQETFHVLNIDEDAELIEVQYVDGEVEEIDLDTWAELDLELAQKPEGWTASETDDEDEDDLEDDEDEDDWEDDEDEDDDDDDDDDWEEDEKDGGNY